jgi:chromosome segregation ATPase
MGYKERQILGSTEENIQGRKQGIEMTHKLDAKEIAEQENSEGKEVWAEELRAADERANKFRDQTIKLERELIDVNENLKTLKGQIEVRDKEILRLQGLYEGGHNIDKLTSKYIEESNDETIAKLHNHLDFLNKENRRLENELKKYRPEDRSALEASYKTMMSQMTRKNEQLSAIVKEKDAMINSLNKAKETLNDKLNQTTKECEGKCLDEQQRSLGLLQQIKELESRLSGTQKEMEGHLKAAYASDKKAYTGAMEDLKNEKSVLTKQNEELIAEVRKLKGLIEDARNEANIYKGKFANASREIEMSQMSAGRATSEVREQAEECITLRKKIHDLEAELLEMKNERASLKFELERQERQRVALESQLTAFKGDSLKKQTAIESTGATATRLESLYNSAKTEIEFLKKDNHQLDQLLVQQKLKATELDKQVREYVLEIAATQENMKALQHEHKLLSEELVVKTTELRRAEADKIQLERKFSDSKGVADQVKVLTVQIQKLMQEAARNESEKITLQGHISQIEGELSSSKVAINELNDKISFFSNENEMLRNQVQKLEEENLLTRTRADKAKSAEQDLEVHRNTLQMLQRKDIDIAKKLEELQIKLKRAETENEGNRRKAEIAIKRADELEIEVGKKGGEVLSLKMKLNEYERQNQVQETQKKGLYTQAEDIQRSLLVEQQEKEKVSKDMRNMAKELEASKGREVVLLQQVNQLKSLVENLDATNNELVMQVQNTSKGKKAEEGERLTLVKEIQMLKSEIANKNNELATARTNIQQLDATMDKLQEELDNKTEDYEKVKMEAIKLSKDLEQYQGKVGQHALKEDTFNKRVMEREEEIRILRAKLAEVTKELEDTKEMLYYKTKQAEEYNNDLQVITKENQYVNAELTRASQAQVNLKQVTEELQIREREASQALRAAELEREDIIRSYKMVCETNERQKIDIDGLANENKELHARLQEMNQDLCGMDLQLQTMAQNEQKYIAEIQMQERQIGQMAQELENAQIVVNEAENTKRMIMSEAENHKQVLN